MKYFKFHILSIVFLITLNVLSAQKQSGKISNTIILNNATDSLQYSLGVFVGQWLVNSNFTISNPALFNKGLDDVLSNKPRMISDSTIVPLIAAQQLSTQNEKSRLQEEQLFSALKGKSGIGALPNGVHYMVVKTGNGIRPNASDTIVFDAVGAFPDGSIFEDSYKKNQQIINITQNLIPGLSEAIQLMPEGSVWRIFVPSALAYGPAGLANVIPPNTALVYEISLKKVMK